MRVARLQAVLTLLWLGAALSWAFWHAASPAVALAGAAGILLAHAFVLALEFAWQRRVSRSDATPRASVGQLFRAWLAEVVVAPQVFCWRQPFRARRFADQCDPSHRGRRGMVLVHGYVCNRGAWNPWMERLVREGRPFVAVNLEPVFGSIDHYVPTVEAAVARMTQATGQAPLLVGHSMGGLAVRAWLREYRDPARVHRIVTIGSPHHGAWLARFAHSLNARQLQLGHAWLRGLEAGSPPGWSRHFVCFYSNADNIVFPPATATLPGADNRLVPGAAHVQMAYRPEVVDAVFALLDAPAISAGGASSLASASSVGSSRNSS